MSENLKDILSNLNPDIDQETLLLYLQGKLSAGEQHEVEKKMIDSDFDSEALEGLQAFKDKREIAVLVEQLKKDLQKRTEKKKKARQKLNYNLDPWVIVAIVLILFLAVMAYIVIRQQLRQ